MIKGSFHIAKVMHWLFEMDFDNVFPKYYDWLLNLFVVVNLYADGQLFALLRTYGAENSVNNLKIIFFPKKKILSEELVYFIWYIFETQYAYNKSFFTKFHQNSAKIRLADEFFFSFLNDDGCSVYQ